MQYLAILGRQGELAILELESIMGAERVEPFGKTAILHKSPNINMLGGTQKIGRIIYRGQIDRLESIDLPLNELATQGGKTTFGLSYYGLHLNHKSVIAAGLQLKKRLKQHGPVRFVAPKDGIELASAQLKFNNILANGFELLIAACGREMIIAVTEQIQDIDWYSQRDYNRPSRSAKVGMLPPKLAQIMLNTTSGHLVYDPFCGTGVVMQEALLQNRSTMGSDISPDMVESTRTNLQWLQSQKNDLPAWSVSQADARTVSLQPLFKKPTKNPTISIVSEGYLGPNMTQAPDNSTIRQLQKDLGALYLDSLSHWASCVPKGTDITITMPYWLGRNKAEGLDILDRLPKLGYTLKVLKHVDSKKLIYRRPNQIVGRQLLLLVRS